MATVLRVARWHPATGVNVPAAVDVYAALCNVDAYSTLTVERGWPPNRVEQWWAEVLARELLNPLR